MAQVLLEIIEYNF